MTIATANILLMNGQTGKVAGNPPLSLPKLAVGFGLIATFLFIFFVYLLLC